MNPTDQYPNTTRVPTTWCSRTCEPSICSKCPFAFLWPAATMGIEGAGRKALTYPLSPETSFRIFVGRTHERHQTTHGPNNWSARVRGKEREGKREREKEQHLKERLLWFKRIETLKLPATSCQKETFDDHQEQKLCKPAGRIPIRLEPAHFPRKRAAQIISFLTLHGRGCQQLVSIPFMPSLTKQQMTPTALQSSINIFKCNRARSLEFS